MSFQGKRGNKTTHAEFPRRGKSLLLFYLQFYLIKNRCLAPEWHTVHGTACTQRLLFHTTHYITKHLHACQGKTGPCRIIFVQKSETNPLSLLTVCASSSLERGSFVAPSRKNKKLSLRESWRARQGLPERVHSLVIPDTSGAGASAGRRSGRIPEPDIPPRCRTLPG